MIDPRHPDYRATPGSPGRPPMGYAPDGGPAGATAHATVITPFYNAPALFEETARCVLGQSLQHWEWIIVNDGSTDPASLAMLATWRHADPRIRVIDHPVNRGLSAARNTGFSEARTEFVFQLDADDLIEPTTLEKCLWFLLAHPQFAFVKGFSVGFGAQEYLWKRGFHDGAAMLDENLVTATAMVRRAVHAEVGGYDETIRGGLEDWDFWLRCAAHGRWGATIPEYLDWYRRRDRHWDVWENGAEEARVRAFADEVRRRYPALWKDAFPWIAPAWPQPYEQVLTEPPVSNPLSGNAGRRRLLMVLPWLTMGGADKFNLQLVRQLTERDWDITIATTLAGDNSWMPEFARCTPDILAMPHFLPGRYLPAFLRYLIDSRRPEVVLLSNSELGYLSLPFLRASCPGPVYVDYCHMEEEYWKSGGHPRYAAGSQSQLDLNIVSSDHLREWMVARGSDRGRIEVCYTCEDTECWRPDPQARANFRADHDLSPDMPVLLYAGRLVRQKQPRVFGLAVRELARSGAPFTALVAGTGPELGCLEAFVRQHRLDGVVRFLGAVPAEAMPGVMAASDIFFLPSLWEGIALSIYEAMSVGLAVVGADVGGQRELVSPDCGVLLVRPTDDEEAEAAAYADVLAGLLADPARCRSLGERARLRVQDHFKLADMADRMLALFERAAQLRAASPRRAVDDGLARETAARAVEYMRAFSLSESLWNERDTLRNTIRQLEQTNGNGHGPLSADPHALARQIIEENMRYRVADRLNSLLKSLGVQQTIKVITRRTASVVRRRH